MPKQTETTDTTIYRNFSRRSRNSGLILFVVFGGLWWTKIYNNPRRVFEGMLNNNLSTLSVTRTSTSSGQQGSNGLNAQLLATYCDSYVHKTGAGL